MWKEGVNTTEELMESIQNDISTLISRTYNTHISPIQLSLIRKAYAQIAVKLLKFKFDYKEISNNFIKRVKLEEAVVKNETPNSRYFSFKLDPVKIEEVALYLNAIIDKDFFLSVNPEKPYLKVDILNAISFLFSCKLNEMPANHNKQFNSIPNISGVNDLQNDEPNALSPFLMHTQNVKLARRIKEVFNIEKGKNIRLLLKALDENDPKLIVIGSRGFKEVYVALKETFGRDIGTYQGIVGYKYNEVADKQDYDAIQQKIKSHFKRIVTGLKLLMIIRMLTCYVELKMQERSSEFFCRSNDIRGN